MSSWQFCGGVDFLWLIQYILWDKLVFSVLVRVQSLGLEVWDSRFMLWDWGFRVLAARPLLLRYFFFFIITLGPRDERYTSLWAWNTSRLRNRFTFMRGSCSSTENHACPHHSGCWSCTNWQASRACRCEFSSWKTAKAAVASSMRTPAGAVSPKKVSPKNLQKFHPKIYVALTDLSMRYTHNVIFDTD